MEAIMITGGQGFIGHHITQRLAAGGRRVISYNRDFATDEDGAHMVQGELFDVPRLVRVSKSTGSSRSCTPPRCRTRRCHWISPSPRLRRTWRAPSVCSKPHASPMSGVL